MDCREFRKQHFAYLDDTLPGDTMSAAQRHVMACDSCAAHDTMVRRSLMLVRNMSVIEPSADFRKKMQARLDETRAETQRERSLMIERDFKSPNRSSVKQPIVLSAVAASVLMMGAVVWRQTSTTQPTVAAAPATAVIEKPAVDTTLQPIHLTPEMVQAMSTGNPMWPAALMVDDAPAQLVNSEFTAVKSLRD